MDASLSIDLRCAARFALGALAWALAWGAMVALDGRVDLANLAMVFVLGATVATLWLPVSVSLPVSTLAVLGFNWVFVPPRGSLSVERPQNAVLLVAMLGVTWIAAVLMGRLRAAAEAARGHAAQVEGLRHFAEVLRDAADPWARLDLLAAALQPLAPVEASAAGPGAGGVKMLVFKGALPPLNDEASTLLQGEPNEEEKAGLWHCARGGQAFGPGTGRYAELPGWYLPLRGRESRHGAVLIEGADEHRDGEARRAQAQSLCDQFGLALERAWTARAATEARELAQLQGVRNAMLAAISHDYRTPLATILGAASSLTDQGDRLDATQRRRLAQTIADEAVQLSRLTDNTLQLARLDAPGMQLRLDWESAEELVGAVLRRARRHDPERRVRVRLEPGLPLVRCDALLLAQMLDNLVDNALKYSEPPAPVELLVRLQGDTLVFAVRDRGVGVAPAWRERIFAAFERGEVRHEARDESKGEGRHDEAVDAAATFDDRPARRGAGVGLAVCRAIARAHGGELKKLRPRGHGGSSFEFWLPCGGDAPGLDGAAALPEVRR